jgi:hypothetical protein
MKKIIFIAMAVIACNSFGFSQTTDKKNNVFIELWVTYKTTSTTNGTVISPVFKVDIGSDKATNPTDFTFGPGGNSSENKDGSLVIKETNGSPKTITNEVDLLRYFYSYGWEIMDTQYLALSSVSYVKYIFTKHSEALATGKP